MPNLRKVHVFKHNHPTYRTCFGAVHVKNATCFVGSNVLVAICCALFYCVYTSQEQRRPNLKLSAIPMVIAISCQLFLCIGVMQKKANLFYPFIALQIFTAFLTAVTVMMTAISVACDTRYVLRHIVDVTTPEAEYKRSAIIILSIVGVTLFLQLWYLRTVCCCFRYFTDLERFEERKRQGLCIV